MTADRPAQTPQPLAVLPPFANAHRLLPPLFRAALLYLAGGLLTLATALYPAAPSLLAVRRSGLSGLLSGALLLAALGAFSCLMVVRGRRDDERLGLAPGAGRHVRRAAGWPQTALALLLAAAAAAGVIGFWPQNQMPPPTSQAVAASLLLLLAPWLILQRGLAAIPASQLPERDALRKLAGLPVMMLAAASCLGIADGIGLGIPQWPRALLALALLAVAGELAIRALLRHFLPAPRPADARAAIDSLVAGLLCAPLLGPASLAPHALGRAVKSEFGLDFSRNWALGFIRRAIVPVGLVMLLLCWLLTGVSRIDLNERGTDERLGVVTAILRPGLHLGLPWPFGRVRHAEFGALHTVSLGATAATAADRSTADGPAPPSADRLWDTAQSADVSYVIASPGGVSSGAAGSGGNQESFATIDASLSVQFRVGLDDRSVRDALYNDADPDQLVRTLAGRLLAGTLAVANLEALLSADQARLAEALKPALQAQLDALHSGLEIVAIIIEAIHPPRGAAAAYRSVQAAEIAASTAIATERGRAQITASVARLGAHNTTDMASAVAAETLGAAAAESVDLAADERAARIAGEPFLFDRYLQDIAAALHDVPLDIVDHRIAGSATAIDLRSPAAATNAVFPRAMTGETPR